MTIISRAVTSNFTYADINLLRADVLDGTGGHNHDGTAGRKVSHSDLVHPSAYAPTNTHQSIDAHIAALHGVHGHPAGMYVPGYRGQVHVLAGYSDIVVYSNLWTNTTIWFDPAHRNAFANTAYVLFTSWETFIIGGNAVYMRLFQPLFHTKTQASVIVSSRAEREDDGNNTFRLHWMAVGQPVGGWTP